MKRFFLALPIVALLAAGCNSSTQVSSQTPAPSPIKQNVAAIPAATPTSTTTPTGWKTYTNTAGYKISYPREATLSLIDDGSQPDKCVNIQEGSGYILINAGASLPCSGSTGVGVGDVKVADTVTIAGKQYQSMGFSDLATGFSFVSFQYPGIPLVTYGVNTKTGSISSQDYNSAIAQMKAILATLMSSIATVTPTPTSALKTYSNSTYGFTFEYPSTWNVVGCSSATDIGNVVYFNDPTFPASSPNPCNPPKGTDAQSLGVINVSSSNEYGEYLQDDTTNFKDSENFKESNISVDGIAAKEFVSGGTTESTSKNVFFIRGASTYYIEMFGLQIASPNKLSPTLMQADQAQSAGFDTIISTFKFTK